MAIKKIGEREGHYSFGRVRPSLPERTEEMELRNTEILEKICEQGDKFCDSPSYGAFKNYRETLREQLGDYITQKYTQSERKEWSAFGQLDVYRKLKQMDSIMSEINDDLRAGKIGRSHLAAKRDKVRALLLEVLV